MNLWMPAFSMVVSLTVLHSIQTMNLCFADLPPPGSCP